MLSLPVVTGLIGVGAAAVIRCFVAYRRRKAWVSLPGQVMLITGATSGIGEALAYELYDQGCHIILSGIRHEELQRVKQDLLSNVVDDKKRFSSVKEPLILVLDLTESAEIIEKTVTDFCSEHGVHVNVLINNAGCSSRGDALTTSMNVYEKLLKVNFMAQVALTQVVVKMMQKHRDLNTNHMIVGVSSIQGKIAIPHRAPYSASKHAVSAFYDTLRSELCDDNIKVCVIYPSYVRTKLSVNAITSSGEQYGVTDNATARGQDPRDVATVIRKAIETQEEEILLSPISHRLAVLIRALLPSLYFYIMKRRADKSSGN